MHKKIRRNPFKNLFLNYEKEEDWLNMMCQKGDALDYISDGYYIFKPCEQGEYIYRIEFLDQGISHMHEQSSAINSKQANHVDHIASINRWQYFRRPAKLGNFEIYSDKDAKIKLYQRINTIWYMLALIFVGPSFMTAFKFIFNPITEVVTPIILLDLILLLIGLFFFKQSRPLAKKINDLKE
ncbi:DUF2812 domain-containing protein [Amphibacillus indicireducens]|uniref:DUF2812 domain-containing protein n=1 Tax=Amphibacillus indicireducens TaxID=1076330 RepID=A0ABP7V0A6_9BACI